MEFINRRFAGCSTLALLACFLITVRAEEKIFPLPVLTINEMPPPRLDGNVEASEWTEATRIEGLCKYPTETLGPQKVSVWIGTDTKFLYLAMKSETPPGGKILRRVAPVTEGNANVSLDDTVEILLDPERASGKENRPIYQIFTNGLGAKKSIRYMTAGGGEIWSESSRFANGIHKDEWHFEAAISLGDLGIGIADLEKGIGIQVARNWKQMISEGGATDLSGAKGNFNVPENMAELKFRRKAPVVQMRRLVDSATENLDVILDLANPTSKPMTIDFRLEAHPENSADFQNVDSETLQPEASRQVELKPAGRHSPDEPIIVSLNVTDRADTGSVFRRDFKILTKSRSPEELWNTGAKLERQVDFRVSHYPSYRKLRILLNLAALEDKSKAGLVNATLKDANGKVIFEKALPALQNFKTEAMLDTPDLPDGEYHLFVTVVGLPNLKLEERVVRHRFEWESNKAGESNAIVPPFTPIIVEKDKVSTILRDHEIDSLGLWRQVTAKGKDIFVKPMELEAVIAGKVRIIRGTGWHWKETTPYRAEGTSTISEGPLKGTVCAIWDYDGTMRWSLDLEPNPQQSVDSLRLRIFLKNDLAPLMNAITDGTRFNYAGYVPKGDGMVWNGKKAMRNQLIGSYVPYLWVGNECQGLAFFGENDRGWITSPDIPCQKIIRTGNTLEICANLIAGPATWQDSRKIELGFLATPIKPMPENWRMIYVGSIPNDIMRDFGNRIRNIPFLGSTGYIGAAVQATEPEPREKQFDVWKKLGEVRQTGNPDEAFFSAWRASYVGKYMPGRRLPPNTSVDYAVNILQKQPREIMTYTNPRGVMLGTPEGLTFSDEWQTTEFSPRNASELAYTHYAVEPVPSYVNRMLWLYKKMHETFNDHIYLDDMFLSPNTNALGSYSYRLPDGRIQPGTGLWNLRNLVRRIAVWEVEEGRTPFTMLHITNTAIAPILSFGNIAYAWEEKAGVSPFQSRFSRDYIRADALGRQFGVVPCALTLIKGGTKEQQEWSARTHAGVSITHEIHPTFPPPDYWKAMRPLLEFGYGLSTVKVHNYWDEDYPAAITGGETSSLLLQKPDEVMLVLCNYGDDKTFTIKLNSGALGFEKQKIEAKNMETGESINFSNSDTFPLPIKKHNFKIIKISATRRSG